MADPSCKEMCSYVIHIVVEGHDRWSGQSSGTCMPTAAALLRGSRDSEHKKDDISFILDSIAMKFRRGVCKYINDVIVKGFIIDLVGSTGNAIAVNSSIDGRRDSRAYRLQTSPKLDQHGLWLVIFSG